MNKMHTTEKELNEFFKVNSSIRKNIAGCLIVSPFGKPIKVELLNSLVEKFKFHFIYDAANALLNLDKSIDKSNFFTICSFHPTKTLGANESGLIITDKKFYDYLKSIINFGIDDTKPLRDIKNIGFNGKFSEYDAAIFLANFKNKKIIEKKLSILNKIIKKDLNYENLINKEDFNQNFLRNLLIIIPKINVDLFALNKQLVKYKVNLIKPWSHSLLSQFKIFSKFKKGNLKNSKIIKEKMITINLPYFLNEKKLKLIIKILNKFIS